METHGLFGKHGRNRLQRKGWGAMVFPFMTYPMQMLEGMVHQFKHRGPGGKKAALASMMSFLFFGGLIGLPGVNLMTSVYDTFNKFWNGENASVTEDLKKALVNELGWDSDFVFLLERGVFTLGGIDISRRVGLPVFGEDLVTAALHGGDKVDLSRFAGPLSDIWFGIFEGIEGQSRSRPFIETIAPWTPSAIRNILHAVTLAKDGYTTARGTRLLSSEDVDAGDIAARALGFQPEIVSRAL